MANGKGFFEQIGVTPLQAVMTVAVVGGIYKVGQKFGLISTAESEAKDKKSEAILNDDAFNPSYYKGKKVMTWTNEASPKSIAKAIYDSKGLFNDDEAKFWGAIKRCTYKTQVSKVSDTFRLLYGKSLIDYIQGFLNKDGIARLSDYVNKLPSGIV